MKSESMLEQLIPLPNSCIPQQQRLGESTAKSPRARRRAAKWRLAQIIKSDKGCVDCGYNESPYALQFDHISDNKKANVSNLIRSDYSWVTIKAEIDKCEIVCANCHAVRTHKRKTTSYP